jgi:Cu(I)/Ag(I) efflux system membrane protein CusA/SilA
MWVLQYNTSVAVWAGAIALIGVAVETVSIMIVFLDEAWSAAFSAGEIKSRDQGVAVVAKGARKSLRPVLMAVSMNIFGLMPVMMATGLGADVMKRISSPMFGGLLSLMLLTLVVIPVAYLLREGRGLPREAAP